MRFLLKFWLVGLLAFLALAIPAEGATSIALGSGHTCAILADDKVKCWGRNN